MDTDSSVSFTATLLDSTGAAGATHPITLNVDAREEPSGAAPVTTRTIQGDLLPQDFDAGQPGIQTQPDDLGNPILTATPAPDRVDTLLDSTGNDLILPGGGNDSVIATRGGDDVIDGGAGDDQIDAGAGDDRVKGGAGRDVLRGDVFGGAAGKDLLEGGTEADLLYGMAGDDRLFGDAEIAQDTAVAQGASGAALLGRGDFLQGMDGADLVVATARADLVSGGEGDDVLVAGQGDDFITGDAVYDTFTPDWNVAVTTDGITPPRTR